jgi:hypothetical protein
MIPIEGERLSHGLANFPGFLLRRADYAAGIF